MSNCTRRPSPAPHSSALEQRFDPVTGQWIVLAADRQYRPHEFRSPADLPWSDSCDFCAGREDQTTPTVASYPNNSALPRDGWQVRVVSNLYPAFVPGEAASTALETAMKGSHRLSRPSRGQHEVIIESATHRRQLTELAPEEVQLIFAAYRDRFQSIRRAEQFSYAILFKNSGRDAGMSREHLHSQLVALPEAPPLIRQELIGAERYREQAGRCVFCDLLREAMEHPSRWVLENQRMVAFCPYASRMPFEVWLLPRQHSARFEEADDALLNDAADAVQEILRRLETCLGQTAYNYLLHSNPFDTCRQDHYHWHIEILPRTGRFAGLEWGTGVLVNTVLPEVAAERLRDAAKP